MLRDCYFISDCCLPDIVMQSASVCCANAQRVRVMPTSTTNTSIGIAVVACAAVGLLMYLQRR